VVSWWWSCRWDEITSLNCGNQRASCSSPRCYMSMENLGGNISSGENSWFVHQSSPAVLRSESFSWFDHPNITWQRLLQLCCSLSSFLQLFVTSVVIGQNILLSSLFQTAIILCSFLSLTDKILHKYIIIIEVLWFCVLILIYEVNTEWCLHLKDYGSFEEVM
jgi:hypothetical protein